MENSASSSESSAQNGPYKFQTLTYSKVMKYLVGPERLRQIEVYPSFNSFPTPVPTPIERRIETVMNSCTFNVALAGVAGM